MRPLLPVIFLAWLAVSAPVQAAEVGGLYEALVPVAGQSAGERSRAVGEGFRQVLVKASGQRAVLGLPALQPELAKADALLGSFRYEPAVVRAPGATVDPLLAGLRIRLSFDAASVRAVLQRARAPLWGASRPPVHLWVVRGETGGALLGLGTPQADTLIDAAALRGLPAVLPAPGETEGPATARVALLATLVPGAGRVKAAGVLRLDGVNEPVEVTAVDEFAALRALVDEAADRLGARYAVVARTDQLKPMRLLVNGVGSLEAWAGLERWLAGLPLVKDVVLEAIGNGRVGLTLMLGGDPNRLVQAMNADGRFGSVAMPAEDGQVPVLEVTLAP
ncbi:MAG: DUF2066 domain-containing protein [Pseudomonadota bacterium]